MHITAAKLRVVNLLYDRMMGGASRGTRTALPRRACSLARRTTLSCRGTSKCAWRTAYAARCTSTATRGTSRTRSSRTWQPCCASASRRARRSVQGQGQGQGGIQPRLQRAPGPPPATHPPDSWRSRDGYACMHVAAAEAPCACAWQPAHERYSMCTCMARARNAQPSEAEAVKLHMATSAEGYTYHVDIAT